MFIRLHRNKASKHASVQVLESYREGGKVKQRLLHTLGVIRCEEDKNRLLYMGHALINKLEQEQIPEDPTLFDLGPRQIKKTAKAKAYNGWVNPKDLTHVRDEVSGFEEVSSALCKQIGFDEILQIIDQQGDRSFSTKEIISMLIAKRLQAPHSKRESLRQEIFEKGYLPFPLHQVYRAMDTLEPYREEFQKTAYNAAVKLLDQKIECFFYDATTLYFESVKADSLRNFGFGKDGKFNQVQILFCLLVTDEGLPIGYEVFSGNTGEVSTFKKAIESLSQRVEVSQWTLVCDRGMLSGDNLRFAHEEKKVNYIVGEKLRSFKREHQVVIFKKELYEKKGELLIREIAHPTRANSRLILVYSEDRAKKDKSDRERLLKKLLKKLEKKKTTTPKDFVSNKGVLKFMKVEGGHASLNREAILNDERWDGFFGITTNHPDLSAETVLSQYRGLWQVEATFRVAKHNLAARPIFHWSPHRVETHLLVCFLALVIERHLEVILKKKRTPLTVDAIHQALTACRRIIFQDKRTSSVYEMPSNKTLQAKQIYAALGLNCRSTTQILAQPAASVVCTQRSVRPQDIGIMTL